MIYPLRLYNPTPSIARRVRSIFNIKCWVQLKLEITPPQLHGSFDLDINMAEMYTVKVAIKSTDPYRPTLRSEGINRKIEIRYSNATIPQAIPSDKSFKNVVLFITMAVPLMLNDLFKAV